jgi:hypothetical protein
MALPSVVGLKVPVKEEHIEIVLNGIGPYAVIYEFVFIIKH